MSDIPPSYSPPPPPPPSAPPPPAQPGYALPPNYQGPTAPDYAQPYQQQPYPPQWQQQVSPGVVAAGGASAFLYQLGGPAAWSIGFGLVSIVVPFFFNYYFPILPIAGFISAIRAMQRGRLIGGVIGIVVNVVGGIVSLIDSGLILR